MPSTQVVAAHPAAPRQAFSKEFRPQPRLSIALLLVLTALTVACGMPADGASSQTFKASKSPTQPGANQITLTSSFPLATVNVPFNSVIAVSGGSAPYQFVLSAGKLPAGLMLNPYAGSISGTPTVAGTYDFTVSVTDVPNSHHGVQAMNLVVNDYGNVSVAITPTSTTVTSGSKQQFGAFVTGTSNTSVTWSATLGSVSSSGVFTAPAVTTVTPVGVTATSVADPTRKATASVTVTATETLSSPVISTSSVPSAVEGQPYSATLAAAGGKPPYQWGLASGTLPAGLTLDLASGIISGTPTASGDFTFTARVTDTAAQGDTQSLALSVDSQTGGNFDGPAELPRVYVASSMADTPAPGSTITVNAGGDFQSALNSASCGDTITLQAGAVFTGNFTLPARTCDDGHWIIVRTSAPDSALPPEGTRMTPCYSGVASLPGRPALHCSSTQVVTAQLLASGSGGAITYASGASHYRFIGLEITRVPATSALPIVYQLAQVTDGGAADHLIFDRVWVHGTAQDETGHGIRLNGVTTSAIVDSYFSDFHCISVTGACTDAQAISGGNGDIQGGPFKIENNFLEASGENIIFGGGTGTTVPADITIRRNHFFKPMTWLQGQPGYVGGVDGNPFIVKNHFELKDAQRVLFEANVLENSWGGFSQVGWGIVLTPRGSWAAVQDITIRYCTISHVGAGMQLAGTQNEENGIWVDSLAAQRWSVHDVIIDDVNATTYAGSGNLFQVSSSLVTKTFNNVTINHVTGITDANHGDFSVGGLAANPISANIVITNNLLLAGTYTAWSTGATGACSLSTVPLTLFSACWNPYTFSANALILPSSQSGSSWPTGNYFPAAVSAVQFTNYNNGNGGDYTLLPSSPYRNLGTDGKDLGADIGLVQSQIDGVL